MLSGCWSGVRNGVRNGCYMRGRGGGGISRYTFIILYNTPLNSSTPRRSRAGNDDTAIGWCHLTPSASTLQNPIVPLVGHHPTTIPIHPAPYILIQTYVLQETKAANDDTAVGRGKVVNIRNEFCAVTLGKRFVLLFLFCACH